MSQQPDNESYTSNNPTASLSLVQSGTDRSQDQIKPVSAPTTHDHGCHRAQDTCTPAEQRPSFLSLPPEIHLLINKELLYPDALSLKHTNRYFYSLTDTGVRLKVEWLLLRRGLHLDCPSNTKCELGSDLRFCRGSIR